MVELFNYTPPVGILTTENLNTLCQNAHLSFMSSGIMNSVMFIVGVLILDYFASDAIEEKYAWTKKYRLFKFAYLLAVLNILVLLWFGS